ADVAQAQIVRAAIAGGDVPGTGAVRRHTPDIVAVVNQQALAVLGPARVAVGGGCAGRVGVLVEELHAQGRRQVRLPAVGHGHGIPVLAVEVQKVAAGGRPRHTAAPCAAVVFRDEQGARAGDGIYRVGVGVMFVVIGQR